MNTLARILLVEDYPKALVGKPPDFPGFVEPFKGLCLSRACINQRPPGCVGRSVEQ